MVAYWTKETMINTPVFKAHLNVEVIPGEGVLIMLEASAKALHGGAYEKIVPLIDGIRSADAIVDALDGQVDAAKVYYVLNILEAKGYLAEATADIIQERARLVAPLANTTCQHKLADTACWTAAARAAESARADRLFNDPWADVLAGAIGKTWLESHSEFCDPLAIRTRFFDDFLLDATSVHRIRQVVILAAGMDTRALRLEWPAGTRIFELDQPTLVAMKKQTLLANGIDSPAWRTVVGVDLNEDWEAALLAAGFDPDLPSAWLLEGLLVYLPAPAVAQLLERVAALAAQDSQLGCDVVNCSMLTSILSRTMINWFSDTGVAWRFGTDNPELLFNEHGWAATRSCAAATAQRYGRPAPAAMPRSLRNVPGAFFVTATLARDQTEN